ncbi:hypothetical protein Naga_100067g29 [Nannochloropsis gaditana]|uniref:Uncharacterized protein n=1 Tax=Nannochloropsis gaditana TaxID=72520 RepID=W7TNU8_9STRA|nr:hypothetical protein Naga_100067g29 [Nannochloropsis gaditana]
MSDGSSVRLAGCCTSRRIRFLLFVPSVSSLGRVPCGLGHSQFSAGVGHEMAGVMTTGVVIAASGPAGGDAGSEGSGAGSLLPRTTSGLRLLGARISIIRFKVRTASCRETRRAGALLRKLEWTRRDFSACTSSRVAVSFRISRSIHPLKRRSNRKGSSEASRRASHCVHSSKSLANLFLPSPSVPATISQSSFALTCPTSVKDTNRDFQGRELVTFECLTCPNVFGQTSKRKEDES